ncbi:hypothetical protein IU500_24530 [Nocardia terpenica]|uniref:hypothetical protein n=1 Tax=Nocardia terpenica TaxID=455432 RepID=UPI0018942FF2|nr:hypothetical protein [Nocardia terpenica]MBF6064667.1 hypothetical protein [Nocardia terpenica]MBF6107183.1 hypothetical protein [Nocardia terpenica]MBF6114941.1 hypothetical protein [Nocardia terpenica]MBF6122046.1 hypothetical protein [Nocardia terpenica]MBF6154429.1 hypothetical protein [Nocardia terpenica]
MLVIPRVDPGRNTACTNLPRGPQTGLRVRRPMPPATLNLPDRELRSIESGPGLIERWRQNYRHI